jgi:hypothetical protein
VNATIAIPIAATIASPAFNGMFACSSADSIMLVAPRLAAALSADRAALRRNANLPNRPLLSVSAPRRPSRFCTPACRPRLPEEDDDEEEHGDRCSSRRERQEHLGQS